MSESFKESDKHRRRGIALVATVLFHAAIVGVLLALGLRYDSAAAPEREWPPVDSAEILFGGEYVMFGDTPEPNLHDTPASTETAATASATTGEATVTTPEPVITSTQPSVAQARPTQADRQNAADARRQEAEAEARRQREATSAAISSRVSFGSGSGATGQPDGNSTTGAVSGVVADGLGGRAAVKLPKPPRGPMGSIIIKITVAPDGHVVKAEYVGGTPPAAGNEASRRNCCNAALNARFEAVSGTSNQTGRLTYNFQ